MGIDFVYWCPCKTWIEHFYIIDQIFTCRFKFVSGYWWIYKARKHILAPAPDIKTNWYSVWVDGPRRETAIFIKEKAGRADTNLDAYRQHGIN